MATSSRNNCLRPECSKLLDDTRVPCPDCDDLLSSDGASLGASHTYCNHECLELDKVNHAAECEIRMRTRTARRVGIVADDCMNLLYRRSFDANVTGYWYAPDGVFEMRFEWIEELQDGPIFFPSELPEWRKEQACNLNKCDNAVQTLTLFLTHVQKKLRIEISEVLAVPKNSFPLCLRRLRADGSYASYPHAPTHSYLVIRTDAAYSPSAPAKTGLPEQGEVIDVTTRQYGRSCGVKDVATHTEDNIEEVLSVEPLGAGWRYYFDKLRKDDNWDLEESRLLRFILLNQVLYQLVEKLGGCKPFFEDKNHSSFV